MDKTDSKPIRIVIVDDQTLVREGLALLLALVEQTGARSNKAEMHQLRGELALAAQGQGSQAEAEACFRQAIEVAQRQEAKPWELRAATSLARLWKEQGRTEEARALLAELAQKAPDSDELLFAGVT